MVYLTEMRPTHDVLHSCNVKHFPNAHKSHGTAIEQPTPPPEAKSVPVELSDQGPDRLLWCDD